MANQIVNRQVNIFIQSGEAQKALDALIKKETQLKAALEQATDPRHMQRLRDDINRLQEPIDRARRKLSGELSPSIRDTQAAVNSLGNRMKRMSEEDADFSSVIGQYKQASKELDTQRGKVGLLQRAMRSFWQEAKTVAVGVIVGNTVQSMLQTVLGYVTGMVTGSARIADELADIEKTTGLSAVQVKEVNKELSKLDTRTSASDLRQLAAEAGKLGKDSVEDVVRFVDAADKIKVALGEDLGDEAIISIGKLSKIFKVEMLNIGSAINEIGANSEASERFAVDFLNRLAGTGPAVKLSAAELLGYGAALEVAGQTAEVSGTALSNFFIEFVRDSEKFGAAAGFAKGELTNLINTQGTNAAFLEFLTRLKEANPEAQQFLSRMQELGIDGSRGANVMLALSNNIKSVKDQQLIANDAIKSNSSIMDEFNKKNNNAAAELDKLKKNFASLFASDTIRDAGAGAIRVLNSFINVLKGIPQFIKENQTALSLLAAGIIFLNRQYIISAVAIARDTVAKVANTAATRLAAVASNIAGAAQAVYIALTMKATTTLTLARRAQIAWNAAMSLGAGPLGVLLVAAGALAIAISKLFNRTKELTAEQRIQAELAKRVNDATSDTVTKVQLLSAVLQDSNQKYEDRKKALDELIRINPAFAETLRLEKNGHLEGAEAIGVYIDNLTKKAEAEAKYELFREKTKQRQGLLNQIRADFPQFQNLSDEKILSGARNIPALRNFDRVRELLAVDDEIKAMSGNLKELAEAAMSAGDGLGGGTGDGATTALGKLEALRVKLKQLQDDREKATSEKAISGFNKQIAATEAEIRRLEGGVTKLSSAEKKTAKDARELAAELKKLATELLPDETLQQQFDKQLQELDDKYNGLREKANGNNKLLLKVDRFYLIERNKLFATQAKQFKETLDKESEIVKRIAAERATNLALLNPVNARLEGAGLRLSNTLGTERIAKAELDVIKSRGKEKLDAELRLLREQELQELNAKELTESQKLLIEEKYRQLRKDAELNHYIHLTQQIIDWAGQVMNVFNVLGDAKTQKENEELARDKAANDKKKKNLEDRLKGGLISQKQYDREVQKLEKEQEKKEKEVRLKQFKRDQRAQIAQALMSGAQAVVSTLAARPGSLDILSLGAFRAINIGLAVAATAAQVAKIASAKPPQFGRGGYMRGPSHSDPSKGLPIINPYTNQVQAYVEGGEGIGSRRTMNDKRKYNVEGTPSQIYSLLNGINGGVQWTSGAVLRPGWSTQKPVAMNYSAVNSSINTMRKFYADGGKLGEGQQPAGGGDQQSAGLSTDLVQLFREMVATNQALNATLASLQEFGVGATVSLGSLEEAQKRKAAIVKDATMGE